MGVVNWDPSRRGAGGVNLGPRVDCGWGKFPLGSCGTVPGENRRWSELEQMNEDEDVQEEVEDELYPRGQRETETNLCSCSSNKILGINGDAYHETTSNK